MATVTVDTSAKRTTAAAPACGADGVQGVVLAGSFPWSDSPLDRLLPRPLLPVAHQPLIAYTLRWLRDAGVREVAVCLNQASRTARGAVMESGLGAGLVFHEDTAPRGPAGCARDAALASTAEAFVVAESTGIPGVSLPDLLRAHRASGALATVVVQRQREGGSDARLSRPAGLYVFERRALEHVPAHGFQDIKENLIPRLHRAGEHVGAHVVASGGVRVLDASTYLDANHRALLDLLDQPGTPGGHERSGEALVHRRATMGTGVRLVGPVLIGEGSTVRAGATLVGPVVLGADCSVDSDAVVARTVAWSRCDVGTRAVVDNCVLADDAAVEPGARVSGDVRLARPRAEPGAAGRRARLRAAEASLIWRLRAVR